MNPSSYRRSISFAIMASSASISIAGDLRTSQQEEPTNQLQSQNQAATRPANSRATPVPPSDEIETDASRCKLARAVLSGSVRHSNGAPTDAYDRQVAENDIRRFCNK